MQNTELRKNITSDFQQQAVKAIQQSYSLLSKEQDLSPKNEAVTESLTNLVRTLTQCQEPALTKFLLTTPELEREREQLPDLCGQAECEMEKYWARRFIAGKACALEDFWYFPEYKELCLAEVDLFKKHDFDRISFLGSGALPMTAFFLAQQCPDLQIVCVDFDKEACDLAQQLCDKLGLSDRLTIKCMDAVKYEPVKNELAVCASLLEGKEAVYNHLDKHNCALIVRDSEGPYQYLYKAAVLPEACFREISKTKIDAHRINTSRFFVHKGNSHPPQLCNRI
jgi:hypothetical protein